ncbi:hypothetical protein [Providencia stuartii]|nr:hypothetical protein [Providencia stuartii]
MSTVETITNLKQRKGKKGTNSAQADAIYQAQTGHHIGAQKGDAHGVV